MPASPPASQSFDPSYQTRPPWDVGEPQPDLMALVEAFPPFGQILDAGCGSGTLVLALAGRGYQVIGVDIANHAIEQAHLKAAQADETIQELVEFQVGDALLPSLLPDPFGAVGDSGFFHLFDQAIRDQFAQEMVITLPITGRYYLPGFTFESPIPGAPKQVTQAGLRKRFSHENGWHILALRPAKFLVRSAHPQVPAIAAVFERVTTGQKE
jgi:SAM-dependent methyltransferase